VSRPLFFYVKKAHIGVIPGLKEYAQFFVSDEIAGPDGPLAQYGLVSDPELAILILAASIAILTTVGIVLSLIFNTVEFFSSIRPGTSSSA
jgi:phosphate transport system substrate-binding protein